VAVSHTQVAAKRILIQLKVSLEVGQSVGELFLEKKILASSKERLGVGRESFYALIQVLDRIGALAETLVADGEKHVGLLAILDFVRVVRVLVLDHTPQLVDRLL